MKYTNSWDLSVLGTSIDDPSFTTERIKTEQTCKQFSKKWKGDSSYLSNPQKLKQALGEYAKLILVGEREPRYLSLRSALETSNTDIQAAIVRYRTHVNIVMEYVRFFELSLAKLSPENQKDMLASPYLVDYHHYLSGIFKNARYTLSEPEERILSMKGSVSSGNWVDMLDEFISGETRLVYTRDQQSKKITRRELSFSEIQSNLKDTNPKIAKSAEEAVIEVLGKYAKVAEKEINSFLENKKINDELRGFERPDSARHQAEDISTKAVDTLVRVVTDNFSVSRDYYRFKAALTKNKKFNYWNRVVEYGSLSKHYSYHDAVLIVQKSLTNISDEFAHIFQQFAQNDRIDVYPRKGKTGGAFCSSSYQLPIVLMLNYTGSFRDITTLAHETGHGIHGHKARRENPLNYEHPMCTAEVASTFCEDFVVDSLLEHATDHEKLAMLVGQLEDKVATIFRQVAAYNFERELHDTFRTKGYLTNEVIGKMFNKHMKAYLGSTVVLDESSGRGWMYWSHFRSPFYVYSYAMALLVSQFARRRFKQDPQYIEKINEFYSTGSSRPPEEIFARLGLDVYDARRWQEGIDEVKDLLKEAKKLAKKLGKI